MAVKSLEGVAVTTEVELAVRCRTQASSMRGICRADQSLVSQTTWLRKRLMI